jgi:hypothetical protein
MSLTYKAADRVIAEYHASQALIKYLRGPRGSTKTTAAIMETWASACRMPPTEDRVRRSRFMLSRATYPSIERTILKSVVGWLGQWAQVRMTSPPVVTFNLPLRDGTRVESEWIFMAVPDVKAFEDFRSLELTGAFLNEVTELPFGVVPELTGSLNRYPSLEMFSKEFRESLVQPDGSRLPPYESKLLLDTNPGDDNDKWHTEFEDQPPAGAEVFIQPGAFLELTEEEFQQRQARLGGDFIRKFGFVYVPNPAATYARVLPLGYRYWANMIDTATKRSTIQTLVCNQWATVAQGVVVWPQYDDDVHAAKTLIEPIQHLPLVIGLDHSGLHPAAVIAQVTGGQLRVLDEVLFTDNEAGMTFTEFCQAELGPVLAERYAGMAVDVVLDPAIMRNQIDGRTVWDVLNEMGLAARPAPTNDPRLRRDAVASWLTRKGGFILSPRARKTRAALRAGYVFKTNSQGVVTTDVAKNAHSHPAEALQYLAIGLKARASGGGGALSTASKVLVAR